MYMNLPSESSLQKDLRSLQIIHDASLKPIVNPKSVSAYLPWLLCPTVGVICSCVGTRGVFLKAEVTTLPLLSRHGLHGCQCSQQELMWHLRLVAGDASVPGVLQTWKSHWSSPCS